MPHQYLQGLLQPTAHAATTPDCFACPAIPSPLILQPYEALTPHSITVFGTLASLCNTYPGAFCNKYKLGNLNTDAASFASMAKTKSVHIHMEPADATVVVSVGNTSLNFTALLPDKVAELEAALRLVFTGQRPTEVFLVSEPCMQH